MLITDDKHSCKRCCCYDWRWKITGCKQPSVTSNGWGFLKPQAFKYAETVVKLWLRRFWVLVSNHGGMFEGIQKMYVITVQENTNADFYSCIYDEPYQRQPNPNSHLCYLFGYFRFLYCYLFNYNFCTWVKAASKLSPHCQNGKKNFTLYYLLGLKVTALSGKCKYNKSNNTEINQGMTCCPQWYCSYNPVNGLNADFMSFSYCNYHFNYMLFNVNKVF